VLLAIPPCPWPDPLEVHVSTLPRAEPHVSEKSGRVGTKVVPGKSGDELVVEKAPRAKIGVMGHPHRCESGGPGHPPGVVFLALMILMLSSRSACATIKTRLAPDIPTVRNHCWSLNGLWSMVHVREPLTSLHREGGPSVPPRARHRWILGESRFRRRRGTHERHRGRGRRGLVSVSCAVQP